MIVDEYFGSFFGWSLYNFSHFCLGFKNIFQPSNFIKIHCLWQVFAIYDQLTLIYFDIPFNFFAQKTLFCCTIRLTFHISMSSPSSMSVFDNFFFARVKCKQRKRRTTSLNFGSKMPFVMSHRVEVNIFSSLTPPSGLKRIISERYMNRFVCPICCSFALWLSINNETFRQIFAS